MFEDWIKIKLTATAEEISKDFGIEKKTLDNWRLDIEEKDKITWFKNKQIILYPRQAFVDWFMRHTKNKKAEVHQLHSTNPNKAKQEN